MTPRPSRRAAQPPPPGRPASPTGAPFKVDPAGAAGDFERFYEQHRDSVAHTLAFAFNDQDLGYEAADEAMVRAFRRWTEVSTYENPEGWVFRVGLNWGRSWIRRRVTATLKAPILAAERPTARMEELAADPDLAAAIGRLRPDHRVVIVLRYQRDWTVAQIATALGVTTGDVVLGGVVLGGRSVR